MCVRAGQDIYSAVIGQEDEFCVLATDGLFDVLSSQEAVSFVRRRLALHGSAQKACEELVFYALELQTHDNVTALVLCLHIDDVAIGPRKIVP